MSLFAVVSASGGRFKVAGGAERLLDGDEICGAAGIITAKSSVDQSSDQLGA